VKRWAERTARLGGSDATDGPMRIKINRDGNEIGMRKAFGLLVLSI
jgi:hypothetical protein